MYNINNRESLEIVIKSLVFTIIGILLFSFFLSLIRNLGINILNDSTFVNVLLEVVILTIQIFIIRKHDSRNVLEAIDLDYKKGSINKMLCGLGIGMVEMVFVYCTSFFMKIISYEGNGFEFYSFSSVIILVIALLIRAVFAGVCEEVFFRGVLQKYLSEFKGNILGIIISSIIFMVFHCTRYQTMYQLTSVLTAGIVLGYIYIFTKSLYMSIGLHIATDFFINLVSLKGEVGLFIVNINESFNEEYFTRNVFIGITIFYIIVFIIMFVIKHNKLKINS